MAESSNTNAIAQFDVIKLAREILQEVETMRSYSEFVDENTKQGFQIPSESRLNAFLRLVGLPMFVNISSDSDHAPDNIEGDRYITPGFDSDFQFKLSSYSVQNSDKESVGTVLGFREGILKSSELSIGTPDTNRAMTLALTNPMPLHPVITGNGLSTSIGKTEDSRREVYKSLFPLITSYQNVLPKNHQLARPFLSDVRRAVIGRDALKKPLIETIARIRLGLGTGNEKDEERKKEFQQSIAASVGDEFADLLLKDLNQTNILEQLIINRMVASVEQIAKRWVKMRTEQERISRDLPFTIRIKSSSARDNPLGKRMAVSADIELNKEHRIGKNLDIIRKNLARLDAIMSLLPTEDSSNPVAAGAPQSKNVSKSALVNPFMSFFNSDIDYYRKREAEINKIITQEQQKADKLRLEVEMMTGEFTGLSVPDVIAIIIGLFLISKDDLISLFDSDTIAEMKKDPSLSASVEQAGSVTSNTTAAALERLETQVSNVFSLLNEKIKIEINKIERNIRQLSNQNRRQRPNKPTVVNRQERAEKLANEAAEG